MAKTETIESMMRVIGEKKLRAIVKDAFNSDASELVYNAVRDEVDAWLETNKEEMQKQVAAAIRKQIPRYIEEHVKHLYLHTD